MSQPAYRTTPTIEGMGAQILPARDPERAATAAKPLAEPIVRIHIIGEMRATTYLGDDIVPRGRKAQAILGCLCLAGGAPLKRSALAAMLWDRVPAYQARASFRQAFRELTVPLGELADELLSADRETIRLNTDLCWIDALAVTAPLENSVRRDLAMHCKGDLLAKLDDVSASFGQWLVAERARFGEKLRSLLEREANESQKDNPAANERADIARRLIGFGPTYEGASRILMRALADLKKPAQALEEYARCRQALRIFLNVEPSSETRAIYEAIRASVRAEQGAIDIAPAVARNGVPVLQPAPASRSRQRVGVLPFRSSETSPGEGVALSLSQEIATGLARFRWFDVIGPLALPCGQSERAPQRDDQTRHNELDFVIDGTLSGGDDDRHIDVRLLNLSQYAAPVWSKRFQLAADEPYRVDAVTARIVEEIDPFIRFIQPRRREAPGATDLLLRAIPLMYSMEREKYEEAGALLRRAIEDDPGNAKAAAWGAYWQVFHVGQGWAPDTAKALAEAERLARRAIEIDPDNAEALGIYGHICSFLNKNFDAALRLFDRSLRLNPNLGYVWALSAVTRCYVGEPDAALARMERYRDLAPFDPFYSFFEGVYAIAYILKGDYERAAAAGRNLVKGHPEFSNGYKPLIAALGLLGRREEAKPFLDKLRKLEPGFTVEHFGRVYPFRRDSDRQHYLQGLRLAGVPEA